MACFKVEKMKRFTDSLEVVIKKNIVKYWSEGPRGDKAVLMDCYIRSLKVNKYLTAVFNALSCVHLYLRADKMGNVANRQCNIAIIIV